MANSFSKIYNLGEGKLLGVDQSGINGDKTALCIAKVNEGIITIEKIKLIEQREDIEMYINENMIKRL